MASTYLPATPALRPPTAAERFGYLVAIGVNAVMLWMAHQLLGWQWPSFLTVEFERVLGLLTASFVVSMVVNAAFLAHNRGRFRALCDLITAAFGLAVGARMWVVFPFDFTGYARDWSWLARLALIVGIVGTAIAVVVNLVKLVRGPAASDYSGGP